MAEHRVPRILLFGHPGSGKSSLLGALLRAGETQGELLGGEITPGSRRLPAGASQGTPAGSRRHPELDPSAIVPYEIRIRPWRVGTVPVSEARTVAILDCDGGGANALLKHPDPILEREVRGAVAAAVVQSDLIALVVNAGADDSELEQAFDEIAMFLERVHGRRAFEREVGGLPIFLVLAQCDRLAEPGATAEQWQAAIQQRLRHAVRKFADFLDDPDSHSPEGEFLPFGSVDLRGYAVAVQGPDSPEPFGVAELFHDAFAAAERHRDRASQSQRRLKATVAAVAAAFAALVIGAAVEWFQPKPADPGLAEQVQSFRDREPSPAIRLAAKHMPHNRRALAAFHADPGFERLPGNLRDFVEGRLREIDDYREYFAKLQALPCPAEARSLEELSRCEGMLNVELELPANYKWEGTEAALLRDKWLADIPLLRSAEAAWQEWYRGLVNQALALTHASSFEGDWRSKAQAVAAAAERPPFDADTAIPGSRLLPQPRGDAVTYKVAAEFDRVYQASRDWDFARSRLVHLGELADALGLTAASASRAIVIPAADDMPPSERIKQIEEACPAPKEWRLANFPEPGRALLTAKLHESIGRGASRVKRILAAKLAVDTPEAYRRLADALGEPNIRDWGRLLKWLIRLDEPNANDPVDELAAFLRTKEFALDARGFELAIPLSLRVPAVIPNGKLTITIAPPTGPAEVIAFEQSVEGVSQGLTTVYRLVPEKPAALAYHSGDSLKLELPVRSGEQRFTLAWSDGATKTYQFDRWQREPKLVAASESEPATGVKLTLLAGSQWPRLPLLLPRVGR